MYRIIETQEFLDWIDSQSLKLQSLIKSRINRIEDVGHFGDVKNLGESLLELRWKNGTRLYFTIASDECEQLVVLLLGGNKNSQRDDIRLARKLIITNVE